MRSEIGGERRVGYRSPAAQGARRRHRRRIATAALGLFTEHGFGGTTVAAIAEQAGVSAQTVYATFGSKAAILRAMLAQMEENTDAAGWRERIAAEPGPRGKLTAFRAVERGPVRQQQGGHRRGAGRAKRSGPARTAGRGRRSPPGGASHAR